jgi:hypothetical protein
MRKTDRGFVLSLLGAILFNFCFWGEKLGLNALLFALPYLAALLWRYPDGAKSRAWWWTALGTALSALMVLWHNSAAAKLAFWLSAMCAAGFAQEPDMRFLANAWWQYLRGVFYVPVQAFSGQEQAGGDAPATKSPKRGWGFWGSIRLGFVPFLVALVFYALYYAANARFAEASDAFWGQVGRLLSFDISWGQLAFLLCAFLLLAGAFWPSGGDLAAAERAKPDLLRHIRPPRRRYHETLTMLGLRQEYRQSLILLWMLNGLLALLNLTDLRFVWFGLDESVRSDLKGYVHGGTQMLIGSIFMAMTVLFFVFRQNLNFFPNNRLLKSLAYAWLAQNALLAVSLGIRNWRYIEYHGLAYKRIGVALFLALVFFGLYTLWQKIGQKRSMFWLWRQNAWAVYALLLLNACVPWDTFITRHNLSGAPKGSVDLHHMIYVLSDKNLHLLEADSARLPALGMYPQMGATEVADALAAKRRDFEARQANLSWKSWNFADAQNRR